MLSRDVAYLDPAFFGAIDGFQHGESVFPPLPQQAMATEGLETVRAAPK